MDPAISDRATGRTHSPMCAFVILFGVAKLAELLDWSRLHRDVAAMLGHGSGAATGLLIAGKAAELLLTVLAVLSLIRRDDTLLRVVLAGWTADLALLSIVAAVYGDLGRLVEHGLSFAVFAGLLVATRVRGRRTGTEPVPDVSPHPVRVMAPHGTRADLPVPSPDVTRQDLPVRRPEVTRQDLPVRSPDLTRHDLPVRGPGTAPPEDQD
ncbi:hypothetical protein GCM10027176_65370 [Actinoallomurus bryophytorum]